jgi:hypothetical protein
MAQKTRHGWGTRQSLPLFSHPIFLWWRDSEFPLHIGPMQLSKEEARNAANAYSVDHCFERVAPADGLSEDVQHDLNGSHQSNGDEDKLHYVAEMSAPLHISPFTALFTLSLFGG